MKQKNIKVAYSSRVNHDKYYRTTSYTSYPKIQMEGKWLEALGFHVGDSLLVEYEDGKIHISLAPKPEPVMMVAEPEFEYGTDRRKSRRKNAT